MFTVLTEFQGAADTGIEKFQTGWNFFHNLTPTEEKTRRNCISQTCERPKPLTKYLNRSGHLVFVKSSSEDAPQQQRAEISSRITQENTSFRHQITGSTTSHTEISTSILTAIYMNSIETNKLKLGITSSFHNRFMAGRTYKYKPVPSSSRLAATAKPI